MSKEKKIHFIGIGAQKAGTTWLYYNLNKLKEFNLLPIKELHYFDRATSYPSPNDLSSTNLSNRIFKKGYISEGVLEILKRIKNGDWNEMKFYFKWYFSNFSDKWYMSLFDNLKGYTGEITPSYSILNSHDIKRIYNLAPNAKLILILRNPIGRAWSHYRFSPKKKALMVDSEKHNYDDIVNFMESEGQLLRSNYLQTIDNYTKVFPKEQILICFYDAISDNPKLLLNSIVDFICDGDTISTGHLDLDKKYNVSKAINCPTDIEDYLNKKYYGQIKELAERYGGYFNSWYEDTYNEVSSNKNRELSPTIKLN